MCAHQEVPYNSGTLSALILPHALQGHARGGLLYRDVVLSPVKTVECTTKTLGVETTVTSGRHFGEIEFIREVLQ